MFAVRFKQPLHDELVFHFTVFKVANRCVAAVETHKQVGGFIFTKQGSVGFRHVLGYGVVDIKQRGGQ
jgi:hypothetical protein